MKVRRHAHVSEGNAISVVNAMPCHAMLMQCNAMLMQCSAIRAMQYHAV